MFYFQILDEKLCTALHCNISLGGFVDEEVEGPNAVLEYVEVGVGSHSLRVQQISNVLHCGHLCQTRQCVDDIKLYQFL